MICIIALGWLGKKLYSSFEESEVCGSYFSQPKNVKNEFYFDFGNSQIPLQIFNAETIILNLPPSQMKSLSSFKKFIDQIKDKRILFVSSTSVYGNQGNVNEDSTPIPDTENGRFLFDCEQYLINQVKNYLIIRPAGLYGENRHPGQFLAGCTLQIEGQQKINLIDQNDLIHLIHKALQQSEIKIVNAVNVNHPTKENYYQDYCRRNQLPLPQFQSSDSYLDKIIDTKYDSFKVSTTLE